MLLRALEVPHMVMRWLMKYETQMLGKLHPVKTRQQVAIEFVQPETSPATEALAFGGKLLSTGGQDYWAACFAYNPGARPSFHPADLAEHASDPRSPLPSRADCLGSMAPSAASSPGT